MKAIPRELARLEKRVKDLERALRLSNSAVHGTVPIYDAQGQVRMTIGQQSDGTYALVESNGAAPPVPSSPTVVPMPAGAAVIWSGLTAAAAGEVPTPDPDESPIEADDDEEYLASFDFTSSDTPADPVGTVFADPLGRWPRDFARVEAHLAIAAAGADFECTDATQVGEFLTPGRAGRLTIPKLDPEASYWLRLVAVTNSGTESTPTAAVAVTTLRDALDRAEDAYDLAYNLDTLYQEGALGNQITYSTDDPTSDDPGRIGDLWWKWDTDPEDRRILAQWVHDGTAWVPADLTNEVIANLDAGKLTAGSAFTQNLTVANTMTLGTASQNGIIASYNFSGASVGVYMDKNGLVAKGGTITGALFQTDAAAATGIKINSASGLRAFNAGGTRTVWIDPETGRITLDDELIANNGATYRGAVGFYNGGSLNLLISTNGNIASSGNISASSGDMTADRLFALSQSGAATAPAVIGTEGQVRRDTSSARYKDDVTPLAIDLAAVLALDPVTYRRKDEKAEVGDAAFTYAGVIAEQAHALGLTPWVMYDADGQPDGFQYPAFTAALLALARNQEDRLVALEKQLAAHGAT